MINKDKIVFNTRNYFTPTWTGATAVKILKCLKDDNVLVQNKAGTFIRPLIYMYGTQEEARKGGKNWEHYERKRKKDKSGNKKSKNNKSKK